MKLISEEILPESKRDSSSLDDWRDAFLELERVMMSVLDDKSAKFYDVFTKQLENITVQISELELNVKDKDDHAVDVFIRMLEKSKPITEGLNHVREHSTLSRLLVEKTSSSVMRNVKN